MDKNQISSIEIELETCEQEIDSLNEWEQQFLESVRDQFDRSSFLSPKQINTLKRIYDKVV